jgi:hypothetical protein
MLSANNHALLSFAHAAHTLKLVANFKLSSRTQLKVYAGEPEHTRPSQTSSQSEQSFRNISLFELCLIHNTCGYTSQLPFIKCPDLSTDISFLLILFHIVSNSTHKLTESI